MQIDWVAGPVIVTTTLMIVVITVVFFGTPTPVLLTKLKIPVGVEDHDDDVNFKHAEENIKVENQVQEEKYHWFMTFDRKFLKPFFRSKKEYVKISAHPENIQEEAPEDHLEMDEIPVVTRIRSDLGE